MLRELLKKNRSYRRFDEKKEIDANLLMEFIENTRFIPSAMNGQPLKYIVITDKEMREKLFPYLKWAGYLSDWNGPEKGERPTGYILILNDKTIDGWAQFDAGIALQTILLSATEKGFGGCTIAAFDKEKIKEIFELAENLEPLLIIALGLPNEKVVIEERRGSIKYYRDVQDIHHVPKRALDEILIRIYK